MPAIFRWRYVLPRLAIVAVVYSAVRFGLDPLLKYALVAGGEAALGAKVEVADALAPRSSTARSSIDGLAAANPQTADAESRRSRAHAASASTSAPCSASGSS